MAVVDFLTDEKLIDYLDDKITNILDMNELYKIQSYGWLDQDNPNPEYEGHAMWQIESPTKTLENEFIDGKPISSKPSDIEKIIASSGNDFYGLMNISRLSIGLCLFFEARALM